jgi:hypothetical protein
MIKAKTFVIFKPEIILVEVMQACRWEDNIKMDLQELGWGKHGLD